MASGIAPAESGPAPKGPKSPVGKLVDYDQFIDGQLRRTRGQVKAVEIAQGLANLAVGTLAFFLVAIALDHWIVRGGLGLFGRLVLFTSLVVGAAYYFALAILPALVRRVNPVYAAQTIERAKPSLKNSLINFLLFRRQREELPQLVYNALEEQAAAGLVHGPVETAVDRTQVIHRGYLLVGLALLLALYFVVSPKNPLLTIERVMLPWSDVAAPARVSISDIQPGSATAFRGEPLKVSAEIVGLPSGEQAKLLYTTADQQAVDRAIPMTVPADGYRFVATLPEGDGGVQQDMQYHIVAGDAVSNTYRITAVAMPTIVVDSVDYQYPAYTGMEPISIKHRGDLKGLEGTQVTLHAAANQPIRSASIDFNCDNHLDRGLKVDGQKGTITFPLSLNNSRTAPVFDCYQLVFTNDQNVQNPQPVRHTVEVVPDLAPEVAFLAPAQEEIAVPVNGRTTLEVRAIDPDFAISSVVIQAKTELGDMIDAADGELLKNAPHAGPFAGKYEFVPAKLGLHEGDVVRYQAVAMDNKTPDANQAVTPERRIRIVAAEPINPRHQPSGATPNDSQNNGQNDSPQPQRSGADKSGNERRTNQNPSPDKNQPADQNQQPGNEQQQNADQKAGENSHSEQQHGKNGQESGKNDRSASGQQQKNNKNEESQDQQNSKQQDQAQEKNEQQSGGGSQSGGKQSSQQKKTNSERQSGKSQQGEQGGGKAEQGDGSGQQSQTGQSKQDDQGDGSNSSASARSGERNKSGGKQGGNDSSLAQNDKPVPSDGSDDGSGVERILQHQQKESGQPNGQRGDQSKGDQQAKGEQQPRGDQQGKDQKASGDQQQKGDQQAKGEEHAAGEHAAKTEQEKQDQSGGQKSPEHGKPSADGRGEKGEQSQPKPGDGGQANSGLQEDQSQQAKQPGDQNAQPKSGAGDSMKPSGTHGAGQKSSDTHGSPQPDQNIKPEDKQPGDSDKSQEQKQGEQSPSINDREMDAKGQEQGDRNGGGGKGGGQASKSPGMGNAGQNTAADQGGGHADSAGKGENSNQAGGDQQSDHPTGQAGDKAAENGQSGSSSRVGETNPSKSGGSGKTSGQHAGDKPMGEHPGEKQTGGDQSKADQQAADKQSGGGNQPGGEKSAAGEKSGRQQRGQQQAAGNNQSGGQQGGANQSRANERSAQDKSSPGGPGEGTNWNGEATQMPQTPTAADDPNLEYAKKATELALDHLKQAMKNGKDGDRLLKDLGWTREEAQQFIDRQEARLHAAAKANPQDEARLKAEDGLRSLGLRPPQTERSGNGLTSDAERGMATGRHTSPPPEYMEQYKAFNQGVNQGGGR